MICKNKLGGALSKSGIKNDAAMSNISDESMVKYSLASFTVLPNLSEVINTLPTNIIVITINVQYFSL